MEELPHGFAGQYCLDLAKAARSDYADYMFPLMRAVNDCFFYARWGTLLVQYGEQVPRELVNFAHRMREAQTFEILDGFICDILPKAAGTPRPIYAYIQSKPVLAKQFTICTQYASNDAMMNAFKGVRNKLVFHYDRLDSHTRRVLDEMANYCDRDTELKALPTLYDAHIMSRYICGDIFEDIGWHMLHGSFDSSTYFATRPGKEVTEEIYSPSYIEFFSSASAEFYDFGRTAILTWIADFGLSLSKRVERIDVANDVKRL